MPEWLEKTLCTASKKGRYNKPISYCGIYSISRERGEYTCRDCQAYFKEGKARTYPIRENKQALPCKDYPLVDRFRKRGGDK